MKILIAGASGSIGKRVVDQLREGPHELRCLVRRPSALEGVSEVVADALNPGTLDSAVEGMDVVVSCVGASVALSVRGRASYEDVDIPANTNLLRAAESARVGRFVYLGVHPDSGYDHTRYVKAHERVSELLKESPLSTCTIRPIGVFTAFNDFLKMAARGRVWIPGDGHAQTNPVHPDDVARCVIDALEGGPSDVSVGGAEIFTRRRIVEMAFEALGKPPSINSFSPKMVSALLPLVRWFHPRIADLAEFGLAASTHDAIAPQVGTLSLDEWFSAVAKEEGLVSGE